MEILFLYIWLEFVPRFDPCVGYEDYKPFPGTCVAIAGRDAFTRQNIEKFKSRDDALAWVRKTGHDGELWDLKADIRESITVKAVTKTVEKTIKMEEVVGYEIERRWRDSRAITDMFEVTGSITTGVLKTDMQGRVWVDLVPELDATNNVVGAK